MSFDWVPLDFRLESSFGSRMVAPVVWWVKIEWMKSQYLLRPVGYRSTYLHTPAPLFPMQGDAGSSTAGTWGGEPALLLLVLHPAACCRQVGAWLIPLGDDRWQWWWRCWWWGRIIMFSLVAASQARGWSRPHDEFWPLRDFNFSVSWAASWF